MQSNLYKTTVISFTVCCIVALYMKNSFSLLHALLHKIPNPIHYHGKDLDHTHLKEIESASAFHQCDHNDHDKHDGQEHVAGEDHQHGQNYTHQKGNASHQLHATHEDSEPGHTLIVKYNAHERAHEHVTSSPHEHEHSFLDHLTLSEAQEHEHEDETRQESQKLDWIVQKFHSSEMRIHFSTVKQTLFFATSVLRPGHFSLITPPPEIQ